MSGLNKANRCTHQLFMFAMIKFEEGSEKLLIASLMKTFSSIAMMLSTDWTRVGCNSHCFWKDLSESAKQYFIYNGLIKRTRRTKRTMSLLFTMLEFLLRRNLSVSEIIRNYTGTKRLLDYFCPSSCYLQT